MAKYEEEGADVTPRRLIKVKVSDLKMNPIAKEIYVYRTKKDIKVLAKTMKTNGQLEPIIIDRDNFIISGHRRFMAAQLIDLKTLDAIIETPPIESRNSKKSLDEYTTLSIVYHNQQRRKKPGEIIKEAEAVLGILGKNQGKRTELLGTDVTTWGKIGKDRFEKAAAIIGDIGASSLRRIMAVVEFEKKAEKNKDIGLVEQIVNGGLSNVRAYNMMKVYEKEQKDHKDKSHIKIKPIILKDNFSLYNKSSDKMNDVKSGTVQVVFTSPPYYDLRNYGNSRKGKTELGLEKSVQEYLNNLSLHLKDVKRVLSETGSFFLNIGDTIREGESLMVPNRLVLNLCDKHGWHLVNEIIWQKTNAIPSSGKRLQSTYEKIFHLVLNTSKYYYNDLKILNDSSPKLVKKPGGRNSKGEKPKEGLMLTKGFSRFKDFLDEQKVKNVITGPNASMRQNELKKVDSSKDHPALMPDYLPVIPILTTSKEGDTVLDPFSGSGTTGKTSLLLGRKYIGYEVNKKNHELAVMDLKRLH